MSHPLREIRVKNSLTIADLAEMSGISSSTISRIENGSRYKTNRATACLLADALYDIFDSRDLSDDGRPPLSGVPTQKNRSVMEGREVQCPHCTYVVPKRTLCAVCEEPLVPVSV